MTGLGRRGEGYGTSRTHVYCVRMVAQRPAHDLLSQLPFCDSAYGMVRSRSGQLRQGVSGLRQHGPCSGLALLHEVRPSAVSRSLDKLDRVGLAPELAQSSVAGAMRTEVVLDRQVLPAVRFEASIDQRRPALPAELDIRSNVLIAAFQAFLELHFWLKRHGFTSLARLFAFTPMAAVRRAGGAFLGSPLAGGISQ